MTNCWTSGPASAPSIRFRARRATSARHLCHHLDALSKPQGEIGFLTDIRRMNVGMTRARLKLLLVGDSSTLCRHPVFVKLLAYVKGWGATALRVR